MRRACFKNEKKKMLCNVRACDRVSYSIRNVIRDTICIQYDSSTMVVYRDIIICFSPKSIKSLVHINIHNEHNVTYCCNIY